MRLKYTFTDFYGNEVALSFGSDYFTNNPRHVWVICRYNNKWLLTEHKDRGYEFPGGKVEIGETAEEAAIREVLEETGGIVGEITYIAQYFVAGKTDHIYKNVYFANIDYLEKQISYYETNGPQVFETLPNNIKNDARFSFMMKDDVLEQTMKYLQTYHYI